MAYTRNGAATDAATDYGFSAGVAHVAPEPIADAAFTDDYVADAAFLDEGDEDASAWGDEGGSARYALSGELVRQTYAPLDAHFSQTPIPVTAHVLPNAGEAAMQAADVYEDVLGAMATRYPQRVARLRDLYFRVKVARQTRIGLERRDEAIRVAYNERNNSNNERIAGELNDLRGEWTTRRRACETELATMRETLVKRETVLLAEAATAESDLWALRKQLAGEWDAQIATERAAQAGRDAEAARLQSLRD